MILNNHNNYFFGDWMYGFNFIIRNEMRVSFFIDKNDEFYHWNYFKGFNYDLDEFEWDLINKFGKEAIIKLVKSMNVYEKKQLSDIIKLVRIE